MNERRLLLTQQEVSKLGIEVPNNTRIEANIKGLYIPIVYNTTNTYDNSIAQFDFYDDSGNLITKKTSSTYNQIKTKNGYNVSEQPSTVSTSPVLYLYVVKNTHTESYNSSNYTAFFSFYIGLSGINMAVSNTFKSILVYIPRSLVFTEYINQNMYQFARPSFEIPSEDIYYIYIPMDYLCDSVNPTYSKDTYGTWININKIKMTTYNKDYISMIGCPFYYVPDND